jgi:PBP1b-binding outer membrane lipoprotein LpoB
MYEDPQSLGRVAGLGIEPQDINAMSDKMVRSMLSNVALAGGRRPRVIVDSADVSNESSMTMNANLLTDNLLSGLSASAAGRMTFLSRESAAMVERERRLKRDGVVDSGTLPSAPVAGADYKLRVRITDQVATAQNGTRAKYFQVLFQMVDLETTEIVWTGIDQLRKSGQDDVVYR